MKKVIKRGLSTDPYETELVAFSHSGLLSPNKTLALLPAKNDLIHFTKILFIPYASSFGINFLWETLSNAFGKFNSTKNSFRIIFSANSENNVIQ